MFDWMDKDKSGSLSTDEIIDSIQAIIDKYEPPEDNSKPIANLA